jgi:hypothetical protein
MSVLKQADRLTFKYRGITYDTSRSLMSDEMKVTPVCRGGNSLINLPNVDENKRKHINYRQHFPDG